MAFCSSASRLSQSFHQDIAIFGPLNGISIAEMLCARLQWQNHERTLNNFVPSDGNFGRAECGELRTQQQMVLRVTQAEIMTAQACDKRCRYGSILHRVVASCPVKSLGRMLLLIQSCSGLCCGCSLESRRRPTSSMLPPAGTGHNMTTPLD
jgi:hypothetical protein